MDRVRIPWSKARDLHETGNSPSFFGMGLRQTPLHYDWVETYPFTSVISSNISAAIAVQPILPTDRSQEALVGRTPPLSTRKIPEISHSAPEPVIHVKPREPVISGTQRVVYARTASGEHSTNMGTSDPRMSLSKIPIEMSTQGLL